MKGKAKLNWLRGNAKVTRTFHLYYRNFKGVNLLTRKYEITTFEIENTKLTIGKTTQIDLEDYTIGPVQPYESAGSGIISMLQRSRSMMGGMRSKSKSSDRLMSSNTSRARTRTESDERVQFTLTNILNENLKIGISGSYSDGIFEFRKLLIANRVAGKVLTDTIDSAELEIGTCFRVLLPLKSYNHSHSKQVNSSVLVAQLVFLKVNISVCPSRLNGIMKSI